jgi:ParB family chromosome partitioning protein
LTLSEIIKEQLRQGHLSLGHARALIGLEPGQQVFFMEQVIADNWSVRQLEQAIKAAKSKPYEPMLTKSNDRDIERLQVFLGEQIGAPVLIDGATEQGGWLKVKFFDNDTLQGLLERLGLRYDDDTL